MDRNLIVPIYRPRIVTYDRAADGHWDPRSNHSLTTWSPMPDEDTIISYPAPGTDLRKVVTEGSEPAHTVVVLEGEFFEHKGRMFLRTPGKKALDAFGTLIEARQRSPEIRFHAAPAIAPPPVSIAPPPRPSGPVKQLSLFALEAP